MFIVYLIWCCINKDLFILFFFSAELGDYDVSQHNAALVSEFRFHPQQTEEMEEQTLEKFREMRWGEEGKWREMRWGEEGKWREMRWGDGGADLGEVPGDEVNCYRREWKWGKLLGEELRNRRSRSSGRLGELKESSDGKWGELLG